VENNQLEAATLNSKRKSSLGESLIAARERRGLSRETVAEQTHIPAHYLRMLEDDDYRLISDQLYILPFLRKYASFLDIDQDETAMRLLREVQRVDSSSSPVRLDEPLEKSRRHRRRNWSKPILFGGLVAVIIGAYIAQSRHSQTESSFAPTASPQSAAVSSPSVASKESLTLPAGTQTSAGRDERSRSDPANRPATAMATSNGATTQTPGQERLTATNAVKPRSALQRANREASQLANH
jgi:cytoskeletal protein RodZ